MQNNEAGNKMLNACGTVGSRFTDTSLSLELKEEDESPTEPKIWAQHGRVVAFLVLLPRRCSVSAHDCRLSPIIFTFRFLFFLFFFLFPRDL